MAILPMQTMRPMAHGLRSWQWLTLIKVGQVMFPGKKFLSGVRGAKCSCDHLSATRSAADKMITWRLQHTLAVEEILAPAT
jgi:hypothetical protein